MDIAQAVTLSLVQGLTEFLPVSSSAHLILVPVLADWPDQGLAFDVAVHLGTLFAVVGYFRVELCRMISDWVRSVRRGRPEGDSRMVWMIALGTVPAGGFGLLVNAWAGEALRSPAVIAWATIGFGLLLWWSDRTGGRVRGLESLTWRDVAIVGFAQALALIPGASRSGVTIMAGLALGLTRRASARFSFLLSIPVIVLASGLEVVEVAGGRAPVDWTAIALGVVLSSACAYLCIGWFLALVERVGLVPFVIYRLVLGAALLAWVV